MNHKNKTISIKQLSKNWIKIINTSFLVLKINEKKIEIRLKYFPR